MALSLCSKAFKKAAEAVSTRSFKRVKSACDAANPAGGGVTDYIFDPRSCRNHRAEVFWASNIH